MTDAAALIVAGGRGVRAGGGMAKQYRKLVGMPVLRRAALAFLADPRFGAVRVVIHPDDASLYADAVEGLDLLPPVPGGPTRQESVRLGLESLADHDPPLVLIHDAARPFVAADVLSRVLGALEAAPAAVPALPVVDTLKRAVAGPGGEALVGGAVDRAGLWRAQTPQGFRFRPILDAHRRFAGQELTDDAAVAEAAGLAVALIEGDEDNVKLTTPEDFRRAERLLGAAAEIRVGSGFDVHRFGPGDTVMLCGVPVPHERGLDGHSDADVGLHALTDALLGAIADGDIGSHFPPSEPEWRGAASHLFVRHAAGLVQALGGALVNADITLICERPKVGPHRPAMIAVVAEMLGVAASRVSIKATTTEGLGFTGRREGIAAQAIVSVRLPQGLPANR